MLEHYYVFFHYCLLFYRYMMLQKRILSKPKWRAQAVVRGARPPGYPVETALSHTAALHCVAAAAVRNASA